MTCSSCSARIAKRLNRLDGVSATVNFATETAAVRYDPARLGPEDIVATIEATGYGVRRPEPPEPDGAGADGVDAAVASLRQRLTVSTVLTLPVLALAMIAPLQFDNWQWLSLTLASPVVIWGGWPFHRAALANLRHRAATMDTLVSMGTLAAYLWSLYALFLGEVASAVTVFLLAGRFFEARAKRRSGAALRALLQLGAKDVCVLRGDTEQRVPVGRLCVGDRFVVRPGEKVAADGVVVEGASAVDASLLTGESAPVDVTGGDAVAGATVNVGGRLVVRATRVGAL